MDRKDTERIEIDSGDQEKAVQATKLADEGNTPELSQAPDCRNHCMHCGSHCIYLNKQEDSK